MAQAIASSMKVVCFYDSAYALEEGVIQRFMSAEQAQESRIAESWTDSLL